MTTDQAVAEGPHNHPARCCCKMVIPIRDPEVTWVGWGGGRHYSGYGVHREIECGPGVCEPSRGVCPACPEHGPKPLPIGCPQCHQELGRPHTDYCTLAPGQVWDGVMP